MATRHGAHGAEHTAQRSRNAQLVFVSVARPEYDGAQRYRDSPDAGSMPAPTMDIRCSCAHAGAASWRRHKDDPVIAADGGDLAWVDRAGFAPQRGEFGEHRFHPAPRGDADHKLRGRGARIMESVNAPSSIPPLTQRMLV